MLRKKIGCIRTGSTKGLRETNTFNENDVELDESILLWHMATDICFHTTETSADDEIKRERCRLLSNYMLHLMVTSPFLLPSGIGQSRFLDTCFEAVEFFDHRIRLGEKSACEMSESSVQAVWRERGCKQISPLWCLSTCRVFENARKWTNVWDNLWSLVGYFVVCSETVSVE